MGTITVNGGGMQVVRYSTASGNWSSRLNYNQSEQLEVNDSGDQVYVHFCFFTCGDPSAGPCDVVPGDEAMTEPKLWKGIELSVFRNGSKTCEKLSGQ
jgi:hypothetical protein